MKKQLAALLAPAVVGAGLFGATAADALPSFTIGETNQIFFKNFEVIYDANGNLRTDPFAVGAGAPPILVGDHLVGIIDVQEIVVNGVTEWTKADNDQFTGYFVQRVAEIDTHAGLGAGESHLRLETGTFDPFGKLNLGAGEMFKFWVDTNTAFEFNGTVPTNGTGLGAGLGAEVTHANLLDDVTKATDGNAWLSFGVGAEGDNADGFSYSHVPIDALFGGFEGEAWYALNNILNNAGLLFDFLTDANEIGTDNLTVPPGYNLVGSSELEQNNGFAGLDALLGAFVGGAWTGTGDETSPWYFGSNDPALILPDQIIPEPGTVILMGMGLVGLAGFARRQRRS